MLEFFYSTLGWFFTALPFVIALLMALGLVLLTAGMYFSPVVGAISMLLLFLLETFLVFLLAFNLGITVFPQDMLFIPMAMVALLRLMRPGGLRRIPWPMWVLTGVMALSFIIGLARHGTASGVEFRSDFYFMVGLFYFSSFEWTSGQVSRVLKWLVLIGMAIMFIAWFRWTADATGLDWVRPVWREPGAPMRVMNAQQTLFLGTALVLLVYAMASGSSLNRWLFLVPLLGMTILVLQHRSVWVAAFLPAMMAFVIVRQNKGKLASRLAVIGAVSVLVLGPLLASGKFSGATSSVSESAVRATSTTSGTFVGRIEGWDALLKKWVASGPRVWAIGNPYGSGFERKQGTDGREVHYAPHNYYVQLLLRTGVIGLLGFLALQWYLLRGATHLAEKPHDALTGYTMLGLLVSGLLYYIPYSPPYIHGLITGMVLALVLQHDKVRRRTESEPPGWVTLNTGPVSPSRAQGACLTKNHIGRQLPVSWRLRFF